MGLGRVPEGRPAKTRSNMVFMQYEVFLLIKGSFLCRDASKKRLRTDKMRVGHKNVGRVRKTAEGDGKGLKRQAY